MTSKQMNELDKELKKVTNERDQARRECSRLKRMLGGAYSLLASHGVNLDLSETQYNDE